MPTYPGENDLCFQGQTQIKKTKLSGVASERREEKGREIHKDTNGTEKHMHTESCSFFFNEYVYKRV